MRIRALGHSTLSDATAVALILIANARSDALRPSPAPWFPIDPHPDYKLVDVTEGTVEFDDILDKFFNNGFRATVTRIQRVQNPKLWRDYQYECMKIREKVRCWFAAFGCAGRVVQCVYQLRFCCHAHCRWEMPCVGVMLLLRMQRV